jgi:NAD(P)-dependent dehydrogenase (short-subunit alcohol dehydrogenase family)
MDVSGKKAIVLVAPRIGLAAAQQLAAKGALVTVISCNPIGRAISEGVTAAAMQPGDARAVRIWRRSTSS